MTSDLGFAVSSKWPPPDLLESYDMLFLLLKTNSKLDPKGTFLNIGNYFIMVVVMYKQVLNKDDLTFVLYVKKGRNSIATCI